MKSHFLALAILAASLGLVSCNNKKAPDPHADDVALAVDETFEPIMAEEIKTFNLLNPTANMKPQYVPEATAFNMLLNDSIRMVVATRTLSDKEKKLLLDKLKLVPREQQVATDAVALIVNRANPDTLISLGDIKRIVSGEITDWSQLKLHHQSGKLSMVFDNEQSSTVRYIEDSICGGRAMRGNLYKQKDNQAVIDYVKQNPHAIGVIGVDWLRNDNDSTKLSFLPDVRVMSVSRSAIPEPDNSFQPFQYYIATGDYPLTRAIYMITTDPRVRSTAANFFYFVSDYKGQLIITRSSQLLPYMPVQIKSVRMN